MNSKATSPPTPLAVVRRFWRVLRLVGQSNIRWVFLLLVIALVLFALVLNSLNVLNSDVNKRFMDALEVRNAAEFARQAWIYALVFGLSTVVAVVYKYTERRLGLLWRNWLTGYLIRSYLDGRSYLRVGQRFDIDNPDQRITQDVQNFTTTSLSFALILLNASLSLYSFSQVLWAKTPFLFFAAVGYAAVGTLGTAVLARRLVGLNASQFAREADLRYELIVVREYSDQLALQQDELREEPRLRERLKAVVDNFRRIIAVTRNTAFFTSFYDYLKPIVPVLVVAPFYFNNKVSFGDVTQSAVAFTFVCNSFSVFISEFREISEFAAVVARVCALWEAIEAPADAGPIVTEETPDRLGFEGLSLVAAREAHPLITDLTLTLHAGQRLLVVGGPGTGKGELLRAIAGLPTPGHGKVFRPPLSEIGFVPQVPYLAVVPLRDLIRPDPLAPPSDDAVVVTALQAVGFEAILDRVGGLDAVVDWSAKLTLGEQQLLAIARLLISKPKFAIIDESLNNLDPKRVGTIFVRLAEANVTVITIDVSDELARHHDLMLHLDGNGRWHFGEARESPEKYIG